MFDLPYNFGDYTLIKYMNDTPGGVLYQAIQQGMDRAVFLEMLLPDNKDGVTPDEFIMVARTRAGINVPLLGTVYAASQVQGYWFVTSEQLSGHSLLDRLERQERLSVKEILKVIETVGMMCAKYESLRIPFAPMQARHIYLDEKANVRLMNTATPGEFTEVYHVAQMQTLSRELAPLAPVNVPGATRIGTLLEWMRDGQGGRYLDWDQIADLIKTVREQLGLIMPATSRNYSVQVKPDHKSHKVEMLGALAVMLAAGIGAACYFYFGAADDGGNNEPPPPPAKPKNYPQFSARVQTEKLVRLYSGTQLYVGAHEVTIEAYASFLKQWKRLNPELKEMYSHPDQPDKLTATHEPEDWDAMWKAASTKGGKWNGKTITKRSPVVNISFWDAYAYAAWKPVADGEPRYRLPSREEWQAIASRVEGKVSGDKTLIIDRYSDDHDRDSGLCGMCSGVMELTSSMEQNPARMKEPEGPVVCGGDYATPGLKDQVEYLHDRDVRRPNIGFRLVRDVK